MITGYVRVSTQEQNLERQTERLKNTGCERIYQEKKSPERKRSVRNWTG